MILRGELKMLGDSKIFAGPALNYWGLISRCFCAKINVWGKQICFRGQKDLLGQEIMVSVGLVVFWWTNIYICGFFPNRSSIHTSHFVNHRIRLLLGFLDLIIQTHFCTIILNVSIEVTIRAMETIRSSITVTATLQAWRRFMYSILNVSTSIYIARVEGQRVMRRGS